MTRVISGTARGRPLKVPRTGVRPTGDRAREALFNSLGSLLDIEGARVLDLYAGSGAIGIEALSRGAAAAVFVEQGVGVVRVLQENLVSTRLRGGRVVVGSVPTVLAGQAPEPFDLVVADPPYAVGTPVVLTVLGSLVDRGWLAPEAVVVVERSSRDAVWEWPTPLVGLRDRRYGEALLRYGRAP